MDEYNSGMDPEIRKYFGKIINSLSYGIMWLIVILGGGLFFDLGKIQGEVEWYNIVYYLLAIASFIFLIRYYIKVWGNHKLS